MAESKEIENTLKIMVLGEAETGKTCLINRYSKDYFSGNYLSTIGIDFQYKNIDINGKNIKLQIWDTAGQECFKSLTKNYFRKSHGFVLAYDITNRRSFDCIIDWVGQIREYGNNRIEVVIVATKCDLEEDRVVSIEEGEGLAKDNNVKFYETSAKEEINISETFVHLASQILKSIECGDMVERTSIGISKEAKKGKGTKKICC